MMKASKPVHAWLQSPSPGVAAAAPARPGRRARHAFADARRIVDLSGARE